MQTLPLASTDTNVSFHESTLNSTTDSSAELAQKVDDLLTQLNTKFSAVSSELLSKSKSSTFNSLSVRE